MTQLEIKKQSFKWIKMMLIVGIVFEALAVFLFKQNYWDAN